MTVLTPSDNLPVHPLSLRPTDDEELQTFTAGELIRYSRCPHQYRLSEIWGYQPVFPNTWVMVEHFITASDMPGRLSRRKGAAR